MNEKREALIGTGMIESGAYSYPNKSIHMPDTINQIAIPSTETSPHLLNSDGSPIALGANFTGIEPHHS